jgi:hypothetical protein
MMLVHVTPWSGVLMTVVTVAVSRVTGVRVLTVVCV